MKWNKQGQIFEANGQYEWMQNYTTPIAAVVLPDKIRVFFSTRSMPDSKGNFLSRTSFVDLDRRNPAKILYLHDKPVIQPGPPGAFDEFGVMVAKPVLDGDKLYLYYMGWQRLCGETAPYQVSVGLAISTDYGMNFQKISQGPVVGIDYFDPISIGNISVVLEENKWRMWYTTYTRWIFGGAKPTPEYVIKYAESDDGVFWQKNNYIAIAEDENGGVATPSVIKIGDKYHMWFGYRPAYSASGAVHGYRIGYAFSCDGKIWTRSDEKSGIGISDSGWDSEMVCYPHVVKNGQQYLMFYCGNGFGKTGFGYAILDQAQ